MSPPLPHDVRTVRDLLAVHSSEGFHVLPRGDGWVVLLVKPYDGLDPPSGRIPEIADAVCAW